MFEVKNLDISSIVEDALVRNNVLCMEKLSARRHMHLSKGGPTLRAG